MATLLVTSGCSDPKKKAAETAVIERAAIERAIAEDKALSNRLFAEVGFLDKFWDGSGLVLKYVEGLDAIDLSDCPSEFKNAFKAHVSAWYSAGRIKRENEGWKGVETVFYSFGGSYFEAASALESANKEITRTWDVVQRIAIDHGVNP